MGIEIERKFLVDESVVKLLKDGSRITQGYLPTRNKTVVRVRIKENNAFLTIKGANKGATRTEFEYPIPVEDAEAMIAELCPEACLDKVRYEINIGPHTWEVDVFEGNNAGLIVAELELQSEDEFFDKPDWVKTEVTGEARYYNSNLIKQPFKNW